MATFIPQIPDRSSRLTTPSVNGASKPAVPVSFITNPVTQTLMPPAAQPVKPFHLSPPANAPVQLAIGEARTWVKDNSDKTGYPTGWTNGKNNLPLASKIKAYIKNKGDGWQQLKTEYDKPKTIKAPGRSAPKGARPAASTSGSTSGSTSTRSSAAAQNWQERKKKLSDKVDAANEAIKKASGDVNDFYKKLLDLPANIRVQINALVADAQIKLDQEHSRLAYFSTSLLEITKEKGAVKKGKASPEIQTAIIEDSSTRALSLAISGNTSAVNSFLTTALSGKSLDEGYTNTVRPFHKKRKAHTLEIGAKKKNPQELKRVKIRQLPTKPQIGDFRNNNGVFELQNVSGTPLSTSQSTSYASDEFKEMVKIEIAYDLHKKTKREAQNQQRKGARNFVREHRGQGLRTAPVSVPANTRNIHAESAILEDLMAKANKAIISVGGTKVACTACQAYYTKFKQEALLGDNTSFAWLSKSSISQLGFDADKVTEYLMEIKKILNARLAQLRFFPSNSGTYAAENLVAETDVDTDSEDEEAIIEAAGSDAIDNAADGVISLLQ